MWQINFHLVLLCFWQCCVECWVYFRKISFSPFFFLFYFFSVSCTWTETLKRHLINVYTDSYLATGKVRWGYIAAQLQLYGSDKNANSCQCKFKNLKKVYLRKLRDNSFLPQDYYSEKFNSVLLYTMNLGNHYK
jgi:hypothetical protein